MSCQDALRGNDLAMMAELDSIKDEFNDQSQPSTTFLSLARPCSKSRPTSLSMFITASKSFAPAAFGQRELGHVLGLHGLLEVQLVGES
jgi:hypothetical protein